MCIGIHPIYVIIHFHFTKRETKLHKDNAVVVYMENSKNSNLTHTRLSLTTQIYLSAVCQWHLRTTLLYCEYFSMRRCGWLASSHHLQPHASLCPDPSAIVRMRFSRLFDEDESPILLKTLLCKNLNVPFHNQRSSLSLLISFKINYDVFTFWSKGNVENFWPLNICYENSLINKDCIQASNI